MYFTFKALSYFQREKKVVKKKKHEGEEQSEIFTRDSRFSSNLSTYSLLLLRSPAQTRNVTDHTENCVKLVKMLLVLSISSVAQSCLTLWDPMDCSTPGCPVHRSLKLMSTESVMPFNHLILCCHLLLLPSIFLSIRVFSNESVLRIRWPNTGVSASASVLPMNTQD